MADQRVGPPIGSRGLTLGRTGRIDMKDEFDLTDEMRARCQEIFDAVWRGANLQKWQHSSNDYGCVNVDTNGRMCGVALAARHLGCFTNELKECSNLGLGVLVDNYIRTGDVGRITRDVRRIDENLSPEDTLTGFMERLREAHDNSAFTSDGDEAHDRSVKWRNFMIKLARDLELRIPEETEL